MSLATNTSLLGSGPPSGVVAGPITYVGAANAGGTGPVTQNAAAGQVQFAAATGSLLVTNSFCTVNTRVMATVATNDATFTTVQAVSGAGSFTLFAISPPTGTTKVNWAFA